LKRVGVIRKAVDFQVPLGGGAYFNPFGSGGSQGNKPLPMRARDSRSGEQMQEAKQRMLQSQQMIQGIRQREADNIQGDADAKLNEQELARQKRIMESLAPQDQRERYMTEAIDRGLMSRRNPRVIPNELAERAGKIGVLGRTAGAGIAGGLAGLTALMSLQNAGAQGQDAISGIGQSALRGAGTFSTLNPRLQEIGGAIGSRLGGTNYGPAANMAGAVAGGAANVAGRALGGAADMAGRAGGGIANLAGAARSRLASPTPQPSGEPMDPEVAGAVGVVTGRNNAATETRDAMNAVNDMSVSQSMTRHAPHDAFSAASMVTGSEAMPRGTGAGGNITAKDLMQQMREEG